MSFAALNAALQCLAVASVMVHRDIALGHRAVNLLALLAITAFAAGVVTYVATAALARQTAPAWRVLTMAGMLAAMNFGLFATVFTLVQSGLLFDTHAAFLSKDWLVGASWSTAVALYIFLVAGRFLLLPWSLLPVLLLAWLFGRQTGG